MVGLSLLSSLGAILLSTAASASLVVIGSKDITLNHLSNTQLSALYLGKGVSLPSGETLSPINQDPNSKIYNQFYNQTSSMDASSVNSYWSGLEFSGDATAPAEVNGDRNAIATVENSSKAIAYVDSRSLGAQYANVKVLYGSVPASERSATYNNPTTQTNAAYQSHAATDDQLRTKLAHQIASLRLQQAQFQQLNKQREAQLLTILKAEKASHAKKSPVQTKTAAPVTTVATAAPTDLWSNMRAHFTLNQNGAHSRAVNHELLWYMHNKWIVRMMLNNAKPYMAYVYQETQKRDMPAEFALLPMVESGYVPFATSPAGASGLWQMMPNTASSYGLKVNWWYDGRLDVTTSTNAALDYLVRLHGGLHSWALAAASYDAGEGSVLAAIDYNKRKGLSSSYWALPLPQETKAYYPKLLALSMIVKNPAKYGFKLPALTTAPGFTSITLHSQIDRAQIATLAGITESTVHHLNPGMLRWATNPTGAYNLVIPADKLSAFKINLARLSGNKRLMWAYHAVQSNESLSTLAKHYHTTAAELTKVNDLSDSSLIYGQGIVVPQFSDKTFSEFNGDGSSASGLSMSKHFQQAQASTAAATPAASQITANDILDDSSQAQPSAPAAAPATTAMAPSSQANSDNLKSLMNKLYN